MRTNTIPCEIEQPCSFDRFLQTLGHQMPFTFVQAALPRTDVRSIADCEADIRAVEPTGAASPQPSTVNRGEWLAVIVVGTIMWTAVFAGLAS